MSAVLVHGTHEFEVPIENLRDLRYFRDHPELLSGPNPRYEIPRDLAAKPGMMEVFVRLINGEDVTISEDDRFDIMPLLHVYAFPVTVQCGDKTYDVGGDYPPDPSFRSGKF